MDNIVYERDYKREPKLQTENDTASAILEMATNGGFLKAYAEAMEAIPKVVVPEDKANYEYLLSRADELAQRWGGKVRGVVSYEKWDATIDLVLPFVEFGCPDDLVLLKEFAEKSDSITFQSEEDGRIRIHVFIYYFEELAYSNEVFASLMCSNPELAALVEQYVTENPDKFDNDDEVDNLDDAEQVELLTWFVELVVAVSGESKEDVGLAVISQMRHNYRALLRRLLDLRNKLNEDVE